MPRPSSGGHEPIRSERDTLKLVAKLDTKSHIQFITYQRAVHLLQRYAPISFENQEQYQFLKDFRKEVHLVKSITLRYHQSFGWYVYSTPEDGKEMFEILSNK